ncbi:MAG: imidazolonepropionase, partial [Streptococcus sp.]
MTADLLLTHFNQVFCPNDLGHPLFGAEMKEARVLEDGYIAVKDGKILAVGSGEPDASLIGPDTKIQSYEGKIATPG